MTLLALSERFWAKVSRRGDDECWPWQAFISPKGYGMFHVRTGVSMRHAHRVAYELTYGEGTEGQVVCHKCDNRCCCNPKHLFLGTQLENIADMVAKARHRTGSKPGRRTVTTKLTLQQVEEIRSKLATGQSQRAIAAAFGVSQSTVSDIANRKIYDL